MEIQGHYSRSRNLPCDSTAHRACPRISQTLWTVGVYGAWETNPVATGTAGLVSLIGAIRSRALKWKERLGAGAPAKKGGGCADGGINNIFRDWTRVPLTGPPRMPSPDPNDGHREACTRNGRRLLVPRCIFVSFCLARKTRKRSGRLWTRRARKYASKIRFHPDSMNTEGAQTRA